MKKNYLIRANVLLSIVAAIFLVTQVAAQYENYTGAVNPAGSRETLQKPVEDYSYKYLPPSGREGGETVATAIPITAIPFTDVGFTCDNINDYDEICPYTGSTAPDVVYSFSPAVDVLLNIDICNSIYDTKLYVYANTVGNVIACNDDACGSDGYKSRLGAVSMTAGNTYYIVIDGYGTDCGYYDLVIDYVAECPDCLPCSTPEGEPDIPDGGEDVTNAGCNNPVPIFSPISLNEVICGRSNVYNNGTFRDTDWYKFTLTQAGTLYWSGFASFNLLLLIIDDDCINVPILATGNSGGNCSVVTISANLAAGTYYLWAGQNNWDPLPGTNYTVVATLNAPPPADFCTLSPAVPVSNWALYIGIGLILMFAVVRFRKLV